MTQTVLPETARIGRTALIVNDLEEMVDFYRDVVGLTVQTKRGTEATLGDGETPLLVLSQDVDAAPRGRRQAGLFHNAFKVPSRTALGAALDRIRDRGRLTGASDHYVSEALYLTDPEGNGVEIYADRPREEWPRTDDGSVRIGTIPLDLDDVEAQSDGESTAPIGTTVGHVHLEVSALDAARAFYVETLGLEVQTTMESALFVSLGGYHHHLGLNTWNRRSEPAGGRGLAWFEFVLPDDDALESARERLREADIAVSDENGESTGPDGIGVTDPDGITIADPDGIEIRLRAE